MPTLTISLTVAQAARVQAALGVASGAEVEALLLNYLRGRVLDEELAVERATAVTRAEQTLGDEGWTE